ncbi:MAG: polysaccharide pyruvyl transferase CsaB [Candidatus Margulisiibacteriota bacterium]
MKVLLSGYYGFGNIGDEAVLEAIKAGIKTHYPNAQIDILPKDRNAWPQIFSKISDTDLLISGGGTLFQNATRNRSLLYYLAVVWLAKLMRKQVMILAQGFGPLNGIIYQRLTRYILNKVDSITVRDEASKAAMQRIGINQPEIKVTADPCFTLEVPGKEIGAKILQLEGVGTDRPLLGIALRANPANQHLVPVIEQLVKQYNYYPVFLPFKCPEDIEAAQTLQKELKVPSALIFRVCSVQEMLSLVGNMDLLVGMRLHSLIFSTMNTVPMVGLSYDPKVEAFMQGIGQPCVKLDELSELEKKLKAAVENKEKIKAELKETNIKLKVKAILTPFSAPACRQARFGGFIPLSIKDGKGRRGEVDFSGIKVDNVTLTEAAQKAEEFIKSRQPHLIVTPNPEIIVTAQDDPDLKHIMNAADLRVPDGISMVVVSKILGRPLKERVSGIDLMLKLIKISAEKGYRIFLLGSAPGVAAEATKQLTNKHPSLQIVGTQDGYFKDDSEVTQKIKNAGPDILFVGLGGGKQEKWCARRLQELGTSACMTIGGSLDVISGRKQRAPKWIQALYIEWLYRLITEPNRWKRQLALPKFLWLMFKPF